MASFYSFFVLFCFSTVLQWRLFCCFVLTELTHYYKVTPYYLEHCIEKKKKKPLNLNEANSSIDKQQTFIEALPLYPWF